MTQLTDFKKFNKKEGPRVDASITLRKGNKIILGAERKRNLGKRGKRRRKRRQEQVYEET